MGTSWSPFLSRAQPESYPDAGGALPNPSLQYSLRLLHARDIPAAKRFNDRRASEDLDASNAVRERRMHNGPMRTSYESANA
jgi:hypothetical protein